MGIRNSEHKTSVIMGDFNIELLKHGIHRKTNGYIDNVFSLGFVPLIHKPTILIPSTATLIVIYTNDIRDTSRCSSGIIITDIADHLGTFHLIKNKKHKSSQSSDMRRIFSETNLAKFKQLLSELNFDNVMEIESLNNAFNAFMTLYRMPLSLHFPSNQLSKIENILFENHG